MLAGLMPMAVGSVTDPSLLSDGHLLERPQPQQGSESMSQTTSPTSQSRSLLALTCGVIFLAYLDMTAVNVAFPAMQGTFPGARVADLSWVVSGYAILFGAALVPAGRLADVLGHRRLYLVAVGGFAVASMACAFAPSLAVLVGARLVQGAFAGAMIPTALSLLLTQSAPEKRVLALGMWGATGAFASAAGPAIGGVLTENVNWRLVFLLNLPVTVLMIAFGAKVLRADAQRSQTLPDLLGSVALAGGIGLAVLGLSLGGEWGWSAGRTIGCLAGGPALTLLAVLRSAQHQAPAIDLDLWKNRDFATANAIAVLAVASMFSWLLCGPLFLTTVWHYSVLEASFLVTPGAVIASIASITVGRLTNRRRQRAAVALGMTLVTVNGIWLWAAIGEDRALVAWLCIGLTGGAGLGMALTGLNTVAALSVPPARFATGTGLHNAARQVGGAFGAATVAVVVSAIGVRDVDAYRNVFLIGGLVAAVAAALGLLLLSRPTTQMSLELAKEGSP